MTQRIHAAAPKWYFCIVKHQERLTTLLHLFADLSQQMVHELETANSPEKINEYRVQMEQISKEVKRIEKNQQKHSLH